MKYTRCSNCGEGLRMKTENKPYPHFCANCQRQIGENDREFWFDAYNTYPTLKPFCSMECISEYYGIGFSEVEDAIYDSEDMEGDERAALAASSGSVSITATF